MASTWPASNDSLAINRSDATTMATTHAADHNDVNDAVNKIERSRMGLWMPRDMNMKAWSNDPMMGGASAISADVMNFTRVPIIEDFTIASMQVYVTRVGSGATALANVYLAVFNSSGTRLGISAESTTAINVAGPRSINLTVDGGQSLAVTAGTWVWATVLIGQQATTTFTLLGYSSLTTVAQIGGTTAANYRGGWQSPSVADTMNTTFTPSSNTTQYPFFIGLS